MLAFLKKITPKFAQSSAKRFIGEYRLIQARKYPNSNFKPQAGNSKIRVLFYDPRGLSFAGTQKFLQILAKHLNKQLFDVFFMYGGRLSGQRLEYVSNSGIKLIDFDFEKINPNFPYNIENMRPHIFNVLKENNIDVLVASGSGYPEFPVANITNLPIVYINVFGSINPQKNIAQYYCISPYLLRIIKPCLPGRKIESFYIQSERPPLEAQNWGAELRQTLSLSSEDFLFGRIGRPDDNIFDPVAILAFEKAVKSFPRAHYLIMAPSQSAIDLVKARGISNVRFLPPSGKEKDVWAFHYSLDAMAHFRKDGETQGVNITESMLAGKPIISHKSEVWNAHIEYLDNSFSRVAEIGAIDQYAEYMRLFIKRKQNGQLEEMGKNAKTKAESLFLIEHNINKFETCLKNICKKSA